jgi:signal transduction histidine kinase
VTRRTVFAIAVAAALMTLLVSLLPTVSFAYRSRPGHVAIETAATLIGLLAALLVAGRFRRSGELADLLLTGALLLLGSTNLVFSALVSLTTAEPGKFDLWSPVVGRLLGALALALAAFAPTKVLAARSRALLTVVAAVVLMIPTVAVLVSLAAPVLPGGIDPQLSPESSNRPRIVGAPAFLAIQLVSVPLYAAAASGFLRRAEARRDEMMAWFAAAATVAAFARLNYFLFPSLQSEWVYVGDFLRLAFYLLLLSGAFHEILGYQRRLAEAAVDAERRRMARDLHDGLAQELAFISTHARRLPMRPDPSELARQIAFAADRALDDSRDAISALTRPVDEPIAVSIARAAEEVGRRAGVEVRTDVSPVVTGPLRVREALVRIVREAVTNATRHGDAQAVSITMGRTMGRNGDIVLSISDDGKGFSMHDEASGFGLRSMRERAEVLGGSFRVTTSDAGTLVEVRLP